MKGSPGSSRPPAGYEPVEHTADIGLRVWAPSVEGLFTQAALGLFSFLVDVEHVRVREARRIDLEAADIEEALVAWLQELLYLFDVQRFVPAGIDVEAVTPKEVHAVVRGEPLDRRRHEIRMEIKAATYHGLDIRPIPAENGTSRWECTIIFDT